MSLPFAIGEYMSPHCTEIGALLPSLEPVEGFCHSWIESVCLKSCIVEIEWLTTFLLGQEKDLTLSMRICPSRDELKLSCDTVEVLMTIEYNVNA